MEDPCCGRTFAEAIGFRSQAVRYFGGKCNLYVCHISYFIFPILTSFEVIESITTLRDPQREFEAVYLLMPTSQNVDRIIKDFSDGHQQYAAAHLFFTEGARSTPNTRMFYSPEL
jgi:Sec1 family